MGSVLTTEIYIMKKQRKIQCYEKLLLTCMLSGKPVTKEEIGAALGSELYMYRISTYMYMIKTYVNGIIKVYKDGRRVTAYQLINVDDVKFFLRQSGALSSGWVPPIIKSIDELKVRESVKHDEVMV